jgi:hypothetical protein
MQIVLKSPDHARHIGKRFSKVLPSPLTRGYAVAAQVLGYKSWDELLRHCTWGEGSSSGLFAWPDRQCMPAAVSARRAYQAATLARCAGIDETRAREIVEEVKPSDGFDREPNVLGPDEPRQHDPSMQLDEYDGLLRELHSVWTICGRRNRLADAVKETWFALDCIQLGEWPVDQFGDAVRPIYEGLSRWYPQPLRQTRKWITQTDYLAGC